ncbi:hypothetical protein ACFQVC_34205 [Streptomyces monticola]|uniref:Secreted protein n=1 Tax=Streptomyces monticola TaxID=2666263 RepID=A0ABW2JSW7_9ACTN
MTSKIRMSLVGAAALGTAAFAIPAGAAQASAGAPQAPERTAVSAMTNAGQADANAVRCSGVRKITVNGGNLRYRECDNGRQRLVHGVLNDTKNNGRCVYAKIRFVPSGYTKHYKDCGGATTKFNTGWRTARDAKVTLS